MPAERRGPAVPHFPPLHGRQGRMRKTPGRLPDLRRGIYATAKAGAAGHGGVGWGVVPCRKAPAGRSVP